jgi:hypothetical protein
LREENHHGLGVAMQQVVQGPVTGQKPAQSDGVKPKSLSRDLAEGPMGLAVVPRNADSPAMPSKPIMATSTAISSSTAATTEMTQFKGNRPP